ncbi:MAG TPA: FecR domain-containing protein [Terriglobales bacterium]|nr:FecR domain-containing protein [Terriglobales bacterium]
MTEDKKSKTQKTFDDAVAAVRGDQPDNSTIESARDRVWMSLRGGAEMPEVASGVGIHGCADIQALLPSYRSKQLSPARLLIVNDHLRECVDCRHMYADGNKVIPMAWKRDSSADLTGWDMRRFAFAAVALFVIGVSGFFGYQYLYAPLAGNRAVVQAASGGLYLVRANGDEQLKPGREIQEGDVVRTAAGSRAVLRLFDGSVIEMNERAEFSVAARRNNTTIKLNRGDIIVQAAKQHGHLYVSAPDCKVAVTGTVFAVNTGMKGSRVSVVEGEVHVEHAGDEDILHSGDQVVTSATMGETPVEEEFDWSQNREQHLALLAEFSKLQKKLENLPTPPLRFNSAVLPITPANTVVYASIPNLGEQLNEANRLFQDQLRDSPVLRDWWTKTGMDKQQPRFEEMIAKVHTFSQYLGQEVVFTVQSLPGTRRMGALVVAKVVQPGLRDFLMNELANTAMNADEKAHIRIVTEEDFAGTTFAKGDLLVLAGNDFVALATDAAALQSFLAAKQAGSTGFSGSSFGQAIAASYTEGAGLLFAADLESVLLQHRSTDDREGAHLAQSGFGDIRHLVVKRREVNGDTDNRALLTFSQQRRGIASWLAAPSALGSLEFVSTEATVVGAATVKSPVQMVDDMLAMMRLSGDSPDAKLAEFRSKMNFDLREDLAAALGSDFAFALDGPILPTPSWKIVLEVNDQQKLQNTLQLIVDRFNQEAVAKGKPGMTLTREDVEDRTYFALNGQEGPQLMTVNYTFAHGYMIVAPSRALLMKAIQVRDSGNAIVHSGSFIALLPKDPHTNVSALLFQNLRAIAAPLAENMNPQEAQSLQVIAANARPSLICMYGDEDRIEVATSSRFFGFDVNTAALSQLLGTLKPKTP